MNPNKQSRHHASSLPIEHDLYCVACGYNLRGLEPTGQCPECGLEIRRSRLLFRRPDMVRLGLALTGVSFLIICLYPAAVLVRVIGVYQLRQHASLESIAGLRRPVHVMWFTCLIEVVIAVVFTIVWIARQFSTVSWLQGAFWITVLTAGVCSLIVAWCAGTLGARLADSLTSNAIKTGTYAQRLVIVIMVVTVFSILIAYVVGLRMPFSVMGTMMAGPLIIQPILGIVVALLTAFVLFDLAAAISKPVRSE